jgi:hypothetical protein
VYADVDEDTTRLQHPGNLPQHGRIVRHVGVRHHGDDGAKRAVADRQAGGVGAGHRQAAAGVAQHAGGQVDADRRPAQLADLRGVDTGSAADLQTGARAGAEQRGEPPPDVERITVAVPGEELVFVPVRDLVVRRVPRHRPSPGLLPRTPIQPSAGRGRPWISLSAQAASSPSADAGHQPRQGRTARR